MNNVQSVQKCSNEHFWTLLNVQKIAIFERSMNNLNIERSNERSNLFIERSFERPNERSNMFIERSNVQFCSMNVQWTCLNVHLNGHLNDFLNKKKFCSKKKSVQKKIWTFKKLFIFFFEQNFFCNKTFDNFRKVYKIFKWADVQWTMFKMFNEQKKRKLFFVQN